jgi:pimeloyl-ACP methyl ester carboxylesterase
MKPGRSFVLYFSGFCLSGESELFKDWLKMDDYTVAGFSRGAIRALEYTLTTDRRIDRLLLFSPAFFQTRGERFISLQIRAYTSDREQYCRKFLRNCSKPSDFDLGYYRSAEEDPENLEELLRYRWEKEKLLEIQKRGTTIEVFLGEKDRIIDIEGALRFFVPQTTVYRFRHAGHILKPVRKNNDAETDRHSEQNQYDMEFPKGANRK